jgi:hypothetical protein
VDKISGTNSVNNLDGPEFRTTVLDMDEQAGTTLQQLVDLRLNGRLQDRVETLRSGPKSGWRRVATAISGEAGMTVGYETLRKWARRGGWDVSDDAEDKPRHVNAA